MRNPARSCRLLAGMPYHSPLDVGEELSHIRATSVRLWHCSLARYGASGTTTRPVRTRLAEVPEPGSGRPERTRTVLPAFPIPADTQAVRGRTPSTRAARSTGQRSD